MTTKGQQSFLNVVDRLEKKLKGRVIRHANRPEASKIRKAIQKPIPMAKPKKISATKAKGFKRFVKYKKAFNSKSAKAKKADKKITAKKIWKPTQLPKKFNVKITSRGDLKGIDTKP